MIEVVSFSKSYSQKKGGFAVRDVSLTVKDGAITGLIGPNGSGKTTLIKAMCGFHYPTSGKINVYFPEGKNSSVNSEFFEVSQNPKLCALNVGYVPEIPLLPPEMTTIDFLKYSGKVHGIFGEDLECAIEKVTAECSLHKFLDKKIKSLSKGQKQRVSFAQVLIFDPPNLILDEPISGLDPAQIIQMRNLIKNLSNDKAILISTHILQEVYSLCSDLYVLSDGRIVASGTESQIVRENGCKNLEEAFLKLTCEI